MQRLLLLIGIAMFIFSCSKSDDIPNNSENEEYSLMGEWEYLYRLTWHESNGKVGSKSKDFEFPSPVIFRFEEDSTLTIELENQIDFGKIKTHGNLMLVEFEERHDSLHPFPMLRYFWIVKDTLIFQPNSIYHKDLLPPTQPGAEAIKVVDYLKRIN